MSRDVPAVLIDISREGFGKYGFNKREPVQQCNLGTHYLFNREIGLMKHENLNDTACSGEWYLCRLDWDFFQVQKFGHDPVTIKARVIKKVPGRCEITPTYNSNGYRFTDYAGVGLIIDVKDRSMLIWSDALGLIAHFSNELDLSKMYFQLQVVKFKARAMCESRHCAFYASSVSSEEKVCLKYLKYTCASLKLSNNSLLYADCDNGDKVLLFDDDRSLLKAKNTLGLEKGEQINLIYYRIQTHKGFLYISAFYFQDGEHMFWNKQMANLKETCKAFKYDLPEDFKYSETKLTISSDEFQKFWQQYYGNFWNPDKDELKWLPDFFRVSSIFSEIPSSDSASRQDLTIFEIEHIRKENDHDVESSTIIGRISNTSTHTRDISVYERSDTNISEHKVFKAPPDETEEESSDTEQLPISFDSLNLSEVTCENVQDDNTNGIPAQQDLSVRPSLNGDSEIDEDLNASINLDDDEEEIMEAIEDNNEQGSDKTYQNKTSTTVSVEPKIQSEQPKLVQETAISNGLDRVEVSKHNETIVTPVESESKEDGSKDRTKCMVDARRILFKSLSIDRQIGDFSNIINERRAAKLMEIKDMQPISKHIPHVLSETAEKSFENESFVNPLLNASKSETPLFVTSSNNAATQPVVAQQMTNTSVSATPSNYKPLDFKMPLRQPITVAPSTTSPLAKTLNGTNSPANVTILRNTPAVTTHFSPILSVVKGLKMESRLEGENVATYCERVLKNIDTEFSKTVRDFLEKILMNKQIMEYMRKRHNNLFKVLAKMYQDPTVVNVALLENIDIEIPSVSSAHLDRLSMEKHCAAYFFKHDDLLNELRKGVPALLNIMEKHQQALLI